jgi:hypothetical protein
LSQDIHFEILWGQAAVGNKSYKKTGFPRIKPVLAGVGMRSRNDKAAGFMRCFKGLEGYTSRIKIF